MVIGENNLLIIWDCTDSTAVHTRYFEFPLTLCIIVTDIIVSWGPMFTKQGDKHPSYIICTANNKEIFISTFEYDLGSMQYSMKHGKCQLPSTGLLRDYTTSMVKEEFLYAGTTGGEVCLFHLFTRLYKGSIPISTRGLMSFIIIEGYLYIGGGDGKVKKVNIGSGNWTLEKEAQLDGMILSMSASIDTKEIICGTSYGKIYRVLTSDLTYMLHTDAHINSINDVSFPLASSDYFATICDSVIFKSP